MISRPMPQNRIFEKKGFLNASPYQPNRSEERILFALESAGIGVWHFDPVHGTMEWDRIYKELYGLEEEERHCLETILLRTHPNDVERLSKAIEAALSGRNNGVIDIEHRTISQAASGSRWLSCKGKAYFNEAGTPVWFSGTTQDISELKRKDEALRNVEERFQTAFDHAALGIIVSNTEGEFISVNKAFTEMTGYEKQDIYGAHFSSITHPDDLDISLKMAKNIAEGTLPSDTLFKRYICKSGEIIWVSLHTTLIHDKNGHADCFFSIIQEITEEIKWREEQQKLMERVARSEARFRKLVNQAPVAIALLRGNDLVIETANDAIVELWGKKKEDILEHPISEALPEIRGQGFIELLQSVYLSGKAHYGNETPAQLMKNGVLKESFFNFVYAPILEEGNRVAGVIVVATDVSDQIHARKKLEASEKRFRNLIIEAPFATAVYTSREMIIETANDAMIRLWGKDKKVIGMRLEEAVPELEGQPFLDLLRRVYDTGEAYTTQEQRADLIVDGRLQGFYFNFTYKPLRNSEGKVYAILNMAVDVTYMKMAEYELERKIKERTEDLQKSNIELEKANANLMQSNLELEQYAYVVSHDMQEPARKLLTFSEMLESTLQHVENPRTKLYLGKIQASAMRMLTLIRDLLSFSHLSHGMKQYQPVNLNDILDQVLIDLELVIEQKEAELIFEPLPSIEAIPLQISQLFYNLINNSLKFTHPEEKPRIHLSSRIITENIPVPLLEICFTDNGIGFEKEYEEKIFGLFQRLHDRTRFEGTGIGLSLCRKVAENHGGRIRAISRTGQGAQFIVTLPMSQNSK